MNKTTRLLNILLSYWQSKTLIIHCQHCYYEFGLFFRKWALMWYVIVMTHYVQGRGQKCHYVVVFYLCEDGCAFVGVGLFVAKRHVECEHLSVPVTHTRPNTRGCNPFKWKWITGQTATLCYLWVLLVFTFLIVLHNKSIKVRECELDLFFQRNTEENYTKYC